MKLFVASIRKKNISELYASFSLTFKKEFTQAQFNNAFKPFLAQNINLNSDLSLKPKLTESPTLNENGILTFQGVYPTSPEKINFKLKYIKEQGAWKLLHVEVLPE